MTWRVRIVTTNRVLTWHVEATSAEDFKAELNRLGREHRVSYLDVEQVTFVRVRS